MADHRLNWKVFKRKVLIVMGQVEVFSHHTVLNIAPEGMDSLRVEFAPTETEGLYTAMVSEEIAVAMESVPGCAHRDVAVLDGLVEEDADDSDDTGEPAEDETPSETPKKRGGRPRKVVNPA